MKCPKCNNDLNEKNECELCGYKKRSAQGFLNYKVYLVTVAVIVVGILAYQFMPAFTLGGNQGGNNQAVTIANQAQLQSQLAVAYGGLVACDDDNCYAYNKDGLYRYSLAFQDEQRISEKVMNYLLVDEEYIYYCDEYYDFYRVDKEFVNTPEKLLSNIYYPILSGNNLYYQDDSDNESIYKLDLASLEKVKLNDEPSYSLMVVEGAVYYLDDATSLKVIDEQGGIETLVSSPVTGFLVNEGVVYYTSTSGLWEYDLNGKKESMIYANEYDDILPFMMINVYQNKLVFVSYQGIVAYDSGKLQVLVANIDFTKFIVLDDHIITIDGDLNYNFIDDSQALEGAMEV